MILFTTAYLIICTLTDTCHKKINVLLSCFIGAAGLIISIFSLLGFNFKSIYIYGFSLGSIFFTEHASLSSLILSLLVSIIILIISLFTKDQIGLGDFIMTAVLSCFMSPYHICFMLLYGLFFSGITALFLIAAKKCSRKDVIPFAPFLLIGHLCYLLLI